MSDLLILPVAQSLLTCLCEALPLEMAVDKVPDECCFRTGEIVSSDASAYEDLCCSGLAWVRPVTMFSASDDFPNPDTSSVVDACGPFAWGLTLEMGVLRCAPTGSATAIPTCAEWTELNTDIFNDARAMRRAMCCWIGQFDPSSVAIGAWQPLPTTGGCAGSTWQVTVQIINDCEPC